MGQKVNPHGLRVGIIKDWNTTWYADKKEFSKFLKEDNVIRTFLKKKYYQAAVSKILIERAATRIVVTIYTARPGVIIGKGGAEVEVMKKELAKLTGGKAISINIMWFYFLMVFAICFIVMSAIWNMMLNAGGLKKTILALVVVVVVVAVSYFVASSNGWTEGATLKDAAGYDLGIGTDPATRTVFGTFEYMVADTSILVTYITFAGAALAALFSAIRGIYKS